MSFSTSSSDAAMSGAAMPDAARLGAGAPDSALAVQASEARRDTGFRPAAAFLGSMAAGALAVAALATLAPEKYLHTGPEYGMSEAYQDHIAQMCAAKATPELLILGDSRAVAGVSVQMIRDAGVNAEKLAVGGYGIFPAWASLDRLLDCGVRPRHVALAFGNLHMLDTGAILERTTNFDGIRGARASHAYGMMSNWEHRRSRQIAYKALSVLGPELTLVDLVLLRPSLRNVLENPADMAANAHEFQAGYDLFVTTGGDAWYGEADRAPGLPEEAEFEGGIRPVNLHAVSAIADLGREYGFETYFYVLPLSELAGEKLDRSIFDLSEDFLQQISAMGVTRLNGTWTLPVENFGDPSHVNKRGRPVVTGDFLNRLETARRKSSDAGLALGRATQPSEATPASLPTP